MDACSAGAEFRAFCETGVGRAPSTHGEKRSPFFPDAPTLKELGYDFTKADDTFGGGPAPLPPDVLKKLEAGLTKGMEAPEFTSIRDKLDCMPVHFKTPNTTDISKTSGSAQRRCSRGSCNHKRAGYAALLGVGRGMLTLRASYGPPAVARELLQIANDGMAELV